MSLLTTKGTYALSALLEIHSRDSSQPVQIREISVEANIPQSYLEQLFNKLKKAGILKSVRGIKGGYLLAKDAKDIYVKDVVGILEKDIKVADCEDPILCLYFSEVQEKLEKLLDINLVELDKYKEQYSKNLNYVI